MRRAFEVSSISLWVSNRLSRLHSTGTRFVDNGVHHEDYSDVPLERSKSVRKPFPTPMAELIRRAKEKREIRRAEPCRILPDPPDNGLLVPHLVPVAHRVYGAHNALISGLKKLVGAVQVHRCQLCSEVHIGAVGHRIRSCGGRAPHVWKKGGLRSVVFFPQCFHLIDRVGKPVIGHDERDLVPRIPAVLELCIQAGVDLEKFPTKRRTMPVHSFDGRIMDLEPSEVSPRATEGDSRHEIEATELKEVSARTMEAWFEMVAGTKEMMGKYTVWTCGYCQEVQVGPKGHRLRLCKARKHQARDGQHAWQEATIDDLIGPNYVWHVRDPDGQPIENKVRRFLGKAPAIVELCVQAGAPIPRQFESMMRLDVSIPSIDELDLV